MAFLLGLEVRHQDFHLLRARVRGATEGKLPSRCHPRPGGDGREQSSVLGSHSLGWPWEEDLSCQGLPPACSIFQSPCMPALTSAPRDRRSQSFGTQQTKHLKSRSSLGAAGPRECKSAELTGEGQRCKDLVEHLQGRCPEQVTGREQRPASGPVRTGAPATVDGEYAEPCQAQFSKAQENAHSVIFSPRALR